MDPVEYEYGVQAYYGDTVYEIIKCDDEDEAKALCEDMIENPIGGLKSVALIRRLSHWGVMKVDTVQ